MTPSWWEEPLPSQALPACEHALGGLAPEPLASYLAALGLLRLVSEQADPGARGAWRHDRFVLYTALDREALLGFFLRRYRPTPLTSPWNGGSGYYPNDTGARASLSQIERSTGARWETWRAVLALAQALVAEAGPDKRPDAGDDKLRLLERCRATFPDAALPWLDAAFVLTGGEVRYPPLLGTGGNDGRLEFTNNFMANLLLLIDPEGEPVEGARAALEALLWGEARPVERKGAVGQFAPGAVGGPNAQAGFEADSGLNPWLFVLMMEGALCFAVAASRRMGGAALSSPFTVDAAGVGYASAAAADEGKARGELWMPLWEAPASWPELQRLLAEGRAYNGRRAARGGVDFARAVSALGVDRGLTAFVRYGLHERNGKAFLATAQGRFCVGAVPAVGLLDALDEWVARLRRAASGDKAPQRLKDALRRLDAATLEWCHAATPARAQATLCALGALAQALATSAAWTQDPERDLRPLPSLSMEWWAQVQDGTPELRLAAALASLHLHTDRAGAPPLPMRQWLEPIHRDGRQWAWGADNDRDLVWREGALVESLLALLPRMILRAGDHWQVSAGVIAPLFDVGAFLHGRVDERRLGALVQGLALLDWGRQGDTQHSDADAYVGAGFALLKLCFAGARVRDVEIPLNPMIARLSAAGQLERATALAAQRLRASGLPPALLSARGDADLARRAAAALLFPLGAGALGELARLALRPERDNQ